MGTFVLKNNKYKTTIGIFGGTFDPVHRGHITLAREIQQHLQLDEMRLIPCHLPPHRTLPTASARDRLQMLQLAIIGTSLTIDERELQREGPSYTIDTLTSLRQQYGNNYAFVLCMGMDAFAGLNTWHRWQEIPELGHIVVVTRAQQICKTNDDALHPDLLRLLEHYQTTEKNDLKTAPAGKIYLTQLSQISVSSTRIRKKLAEGKTIDDALLPSVAAFIQQRGLYLTR